MTELEQCYEEISDLKQERDLYMRALEALADAIEADSRINRQVKDDLLNLEVFH